MSDWRTETSAPNLSVEFRPVCYLRGVGCDRTPQLDNLLSERDCLFKAFLGFRLVEGAREFMAVLQTSNQRTLELAISAGQNSQSAAVSAHRPEGPAAGACCVRRITC